MPRRKSGIEVEKMWRVIFAKNDGSSSYVDDRIVVIYP